MKKLFINNIKTQVFGPFRKEKEIKLGNFNCIYGGNEKGKSSLIEFVINSLFKKNANWTIRDYVKQAEGVVNLTIGDEENIVFKNSDKKKTLSGYYGKLGVHESVALDKLLMTRAGVSDIVNKENVKFDRDYISNIISYRPVLEKLIQIPSKTVIDSEIDYKDCSIKAKNTGERKKLEELKTDYEAVSDLIKKFDEEDYSIVVQLKNTKEKFEGKLLKIKNNKKIHAWHLNNKIKELNNEKSKFSKLNTAEAKNHIAVCRSKMTDIEKKQSNLLSNPEEKKNELAVLKSIKERYSNLKHSGSNSLNLKERVMGVLFAVFTVSAFTGSFFKWGAYIVPVLIGFTLLSALAMYIIVRKKRDDYFSNYEFESLNKDFQKIKDTAFSPDKCDAAINEFTSIIESYDRISSEIKDNKSDITKMLYEIKNILNEYAGDDLDLNKYEEICNNIEKEKDDLNNEIQSLKSELLQLNIDESDYVESDQDADYNKNEEIKIEEEINRVKDAIVEKESDFGNLISKAAQETNDSTHALKSDAAAYYYELLLQKKCVKEEEIKAKTTEIISKKIIYDSVLEIKNSTSSDVEEVIRSQELNDYLKKITGKYESISFDEEGEVIISTETSDYTLNEISTGTFEQIMLILRTVLSKRILGDVRPFFIYDDSIQHTDYERRKRLIDTMKTISEEGIQVTYFTMDDHIKNTFKNAGANIVELD